MEVSIDEPLNVDWDGNELLLSDILGTDEDVIYHDIETDVEHRLLKTAIGKLSGRERMIIELRFGLNSIDGEEKPRKRLRICLVFPSPTYPDWKKDHGKTEKRNRAS